MKKNAKPATQVARVNLVGKAKGNATVSTVDKENTSKKFDASGAVEVEAEEVKAEEKPQEQPQEIVKAAEPQAQPVTEPTPTQAEKQEVVTVEKKAPTLEELKEVSTQLYYMQEKHTQVVDKRSLLNKFAISHDDQNAQVIVRDANGMEFKSSSPKTIAKLIEFWKEEFDEAKKGLESRMKGMFLDAAI